MINYKVLEKMRNCCVELNYKYRGRTKHMDMNNNQIRVKGIGRVLRTPDTIVIRMTLRARGGDY